MNNIILQHWNGDLPSWASVARQTMENYAQAIGCDYELVTGHPVGKQHGPWSQKLCHLDEKYDKYDKVLMLDMDTIATRKNANVFDRPEVGVIHERAMMGPHRARTPKGAPGLYNRGELVFFGNFIMLKRGQRLALREHLDWNLFEKEIIDHYCGDEIIMHYLLDKSGILKGKPYEEICMRCGGTTIDNVYFRESGTYDKLFCNLPDVGHTDPDGNATFVHFCSNRKNNLESFVSQHNIL